MNLHLTAFQGGTAADVAWRGVNVQDLMTSQTLPHVNVPGTPNPLDDASFLQLQRVVDPLSPARGTDLYRRTVELVGRAMQNCVTDEPRIKCTMKRSETRRENSKGGLSCFACLYSLFSFYEVYIHTSNSFRAQDSALIKSKRIFSRNPF